MGVKVMKGGFVGRVGIGELNLIIELLLNCIL